MFFEILIRHKCPQPKAYTLYPACWTGYVQASRRMHSTKPFVGCRVQASWAEIGL